MSEQLKGGTVKVSRLHANAYIGHQDDDEYWFAGLPINVEVSREEDKVRIGLLRDIGVSEDVGIYLSDSQAQDLIVALAAQVVRDSVLA